MGRMPGRSIPGAVWTLNWRWNLRRSQRSRSRAATGRGRAPGGSQISDELPLPWDDDPPAGSSEVGARQGGLFDRHSALDEPVVRRTPQARSLRGSRVEHAVFGTGRVLEEDGSGPDARLTIEFPGFGKKKIVARYVQPVA
jgi:hypothetical protein